MLSGFFQSPKLFENHRVIEDRLVILCIYFDATQVARCSLRQPLGLFE
ncbi:hypothetical protein [Paraburkholderia sp. SIMBA_030]